MGFYIGEAVDKTLSAPAYAARNSDGGLFRSELSDALGKQSSTDTGKCFCYFGEPSEPMVVISQKIEDKMKNDPDYSDELSRKLEELLQNQRGCCKDHILIVNRDGEIMQYCNRHDRKPEHPTAEELKEVAKARARRKARLDAYFHLLERVSIKRKLIEQENAKRLLNKRYRRSVSNLDIEARARQITDPPKNPNYFF